MPTKAKQSPKKQAVGAEKGVKKKQKKMSKKQAVGAKKGANKKQKKLMEAKDNAKAKAAAKRNATKTPKRQRKNLAYVKRQYEADPYS